MRDHRASEQRARMPAGFFAAVTMLLLVPNCGSDEGVTRSGAGAGGTGTGGAGTGGAGIGGTGTDAASGSGGTNTAGSGGSGTDGGPGGSAGTAGASATGGTAGDDGGQTDAGNADAAGCGALGAACDIACPQNLECLQGVCIPQNRASCGGIAGAECPQNFPICMTCNGCDFGPCFRESEIACVCRGVGRTVFTCGNR
jgi:hypothetical protein